MGRLPRVLFALLLSLSVCASGTAQPRRNEAKELYEKATRHYELGEYDRAIEEYKRAYEISAAPALLFNLGQVYRLKKDPAQALRFYSNYLRLSPDAPNRADVEAFIVEMRAAVEKQEQQKRAVETPSSPSPPPSPPPVATSAPPPASVPAAPPKPLVPPRAKHWRAELWTATGLAAGGLALTVTGIALGVQAKEDADQISRAATMHNQTWDATRTSLYQQGQRDSQAAIALDVIGPVLMAGGIALGLVARHDRLLLRRFAVDGKGVACAF